MMLMIGDIVLNQILNPKERKGGKRG